MSLRILEVGEKFVDYLRDESRTAGRAEYITFPSSTAEVCEAVNIAAESGWPVTVQGGRTGITGGGVPEGGLILNLSRMKAIDPVEEGRMSVQPGALLADIRTALEGSGLFFPSDLTETSASLGGMVANNASGARSFKYGAVRNWVQGLEVVLADGGVVRVERGVHRADGLAFELGGITGRLPEIRQPAVKNAAGYFIEPDMDLVDLFVGAEGTLGVVTSITIKLQPEPGVLNGVTAFFKAEGEALAFVQSLRETSEPIAVEFFDCNALDLLRRMKNENEAFADLPLLNPDYHTAIYFEFEGAIPDAIITEADRAMECWVSEGEREIEMLKTFRHALPESVNRVIGQRRQTIPGLTKLGTDMSVPDEHLEDVMRMYHEGLTEAGLEYVIFGHIGNNHVHVNILPRNLKEYEQGKALYLKWAKQVVAWGGSVSAEHGIGKMKREFLELMYGAKGVRAMKELKRLFDRNGLLNPGNLFT
jgi:D-lactate dehydrogenase (cytochrome)